MNNQYDKFLGNLKSYHSQLSSILTEELYRDRIDSLKQSLSREKLNLLIVGEFSRGKSTFINAILGKPYLPASVNPTTATINIITYSETPKLTIEYSDGSIETKDLPDDKINKFLEDYVSVKNASADKIKSILLQLDEIERYKNIRIVDTPGVNDLDESREEITFKYLSEADACIILLDSQQPLSSSERMFIDSKVLQRDVRKIFFVINKIDQIAKSSSDLEKEMLKIEDYVRGKLITELSLPETPRLYSVSSLEALRSKYKNEVSSWLGLFTHFETDLIRFASEIGINERLALHYSRVLSIIDSAKDYLSSKINALRMSAEEIEKSIIQSQKEKELAVKEIQLIKEEIDLLRAELTERVKKFLVDAISKIKKRTTDTLTSSVDLDDLLRIRHIINEEIKSAVDNISSELSQSVLDIQFKVTDRNSITSVNGDKSLSKYSISDVDNTAIIATGSHINATLMQNDAFRTAAIAGGGGLLGAAIIGGPVGIAIAAVGAILLNKKFEAERKQKVFNKVKDEVSNEMRLAISKLEIELNETARRLVASELDPTANSISLYLNDKVKQITSKLEFQNSLDKEKFEEKRDQLELFETIITQLDQLRTVCVRDYGDLTINE